MTYLRLGLHRGERFDAVPEGYLQLDGAGSHDLSEDVREEHRLSPLQVTIMVSRVASTGGQDVCALSDAWRRYHTRLHEDD